MTIPKSSRLCDEEMRKPSTSDSNITSLRAAEPQQPETDNNHVGESSSPTPINVRADEDSLSHDELMRRHWRDSKYAVGLTDVDWSNSHKQRQSQRRRMSRHLKCSYICCGSIFHAGRVGNMVVLRQSPKADPPSFVVILGPYWPVAMFVTYPLIITLSAATAVRKLIDLSIWMWVVWGILTLSLLLALSMVSCRDPGILKRYADVPDVPNASRWRWNDQARTFRPPKAKYDPECAVVIEEFDHTCPWTGTAIGKRNMMAFRAFLALFLVTLVFDIILLVGPF